VNSAAPESNSRIECVLDALDPALIQQRVGRVHDSARECFPLRRLTVASASEFHDAVSAYMIHHLEYTGDGQISEQRAFSTAKRLLSREYPVGTCGDGYLAALATARGEGPGGLPEVVNALSKAARSEAIRDHVCTVFHESVNSLSHSDLEDLAKRLISHFGGLLGAHGWSISQLGLERDPLTALHEIRECLARLLVLTEVSWPSSLSS